MSAIVQAAQYLPSIREPEKEQSLKEMLTWTGVVLLLYYTLGSIDLFGANSAAVEQALQQLQTFQTLLGAQIGSIITLGIGPIVTSSIVLQMVVGSEIVSWNTNTQEGKEKFQAAQKVLAYGLSIIEAVGYVAAGTFGNISDPAVFALLSGQIALGGILIILMDDLIQKWGFGSGTGLFIAAGVSKAIYIASISALDGTGNFVGLSSSAAGAFPKFVASGGDFTALVPILATLAVFGVVVYLQAMRVEIPLTFGDVRGFGQKWPLKFLYTSVMPVILVSALVTNFQIIGTTLAGQNGCSILGCVSGGQASSGFIAWLQAPTGFIDSALQGTVTMIGTGSITHVLFYLLVYILGSIVFSIFWMKTSGQDADSVADQIQATGMKVPGFRKDKRVIKKVLNRYIPGLTVLSGATIGALASLSNMLNAAGGGTGILLTVMIIYKMYEELAQKHMEELHPAMKNFIE
ncbi:preprotein translocase subunit SecY [Candidatus Nanohalobium constans]|uniref:Protein translocase subunit SecY n=1 Tax=Candidatus Nanohalobium constans TaxID=2565781 RepID=A0A5Q0UHZ6_9ARCH|nr:preprotein translocase subunit SecY [Candidatus Nanohalobium constans]QGA80961.1 preprotein translocase subunit SecY [Candidatus Nanohalobium constans]